jgi:hypothetical protein
VLLASIEAFLCQVALDKKRALLIVDEAQNLSTRAIEELRMLSNFQLDEQGLLQSFLIGQPELRAMMHGPAMQQLRQRVIASYHLGPLDASETSAYIEHRLKHVGWRGDPEFAPDCFPMIHTLTGGIPRRINAICNRLMLSGYLGEKHALGGDDVRQISDELQEELGHGVPRVSTDAGALHEIARGTPAHELAIRRLEERVDRVERTLGAAIDLLHGLLHQDKAKSGNLAER